MSVLGELAPVISPPTGAQDPNALLTVFGINTCDLWGETYFILLLTLASSLASHFHTALELLTDLVPSNCWTPPIHTMCFYFQYRKKE